MTVRADPERLRQALQNPLAIALSAARRSVAVSLAPLHGGSMAEIAIEDDGPKRGDRAALPAGVKRVSSNELALAVSEALVEMHQGTLSFISPVTSSAGARVVIRLPVIAS